MQKLSRDFRGAEGRKRKRHPSSKMSLLIIDTLLISQQKSAGDTNSLRVKEGAFTSATHTHKWHYSEVKRHAPRCLLILMHEQSCSVSAEVVSLITREAKTKGRTAHC